MQKPREPIEHSADEDAAETVEWRSLVTLKAERVIMSCDLYALDVPVSGRKDRRARPRLPRLVLDGIHDAYETWCSCGGGCLCSCK